MLRIDPVVVPASGAEEVDVVVRATDDDGNPVSGVVMGLSAVSPDLPTGILMTYGASDENGVWRVRGSQGVNAFDLERATELVASHGNSSLDPDKRIHCDAEARVRVEHQ